VSPEETSPDRRRTPEDKLPNQDLNTKRRLPHIKKKSPADGETDEIQLESTERLDAIHKQLDLAMDIINTSASLPPTPATQKAPIPPLPKANEKVVAKLKEHFIDGNSTIATSKYLSRRRQYFYSNDVGSEANYQNAHAGFRDVIVHSAEKYIEEVPNATRLYSSTAEDYREKLRAQRSKRH
jgi:hypothetical protein